MISFFSGTSLRKKYASTSERDDQKNPKSVAMMTPYSLRRKMSMKYEANQKAYAVDRYLTIFVVNFPNSLQSPENITNAAVPTMYTI